MNKKEPKEKSYAIKVPVYTSALIEKPNDLFGGISYDNMIQYVKNKIDRYSKQTQKVYRFKRNKFQKKEIGEVNYIDCKIGERPAILLKISAYNTNLHDGYVETDKKITLKQNHKLGSDNNYVLLYPNITGIDVNNYKHQWLILIYEDPSKDNSEIASTAKLVLNYILNISTANIKLPEVLEELKKIKKIPELSLRFTSITNNENEVDVNYRSYLIASKFRKQKEDNFKNMPFEKTEEIINDLSYSNDFQKREVKISIGNKEYKITRDQMESAKESIEQTVEEIFNETIGITEKEMGDNLYSPDFINSIFTTVLQKFLSNDGKD